MAGHDVPWHNKLECDINKTKQKWLKHFSHRTMLMSDVYDLGKDSAFCNITQSLEEIPHDLPLDLWFFVRRLKHPQQP